MPVTTCSPRGPGGGHSRTTPLTTCSPRTHEGPITTEGAGAALEDDARDNLQPHGALVILARTRAQHLARSAAVAAKLAAHVVQLVRKALLKLDLQLRPSGLALPPQARDDLLDLPLAMAHGLLGAPAEDSEATTSQH